MRVERFLAASTVSQLAKGIITEESPLLKKKKHAACLSAFLTEQVQIQLRVTNHLLAL